MSSLSSKKKPEYVLIIHKRHTSYKVAGLEFDPQIWTQNTFLTTFLYFLVC